MKFTHTLMRNISHLNEHIQFLSSRLFICLLTLSIIACKEKKETEVAEATENESEIVSLTDGQFRTANIKLGKVEKHTLSGVLKVNGKLDVPPQNMVSVSAPFGGFLKSTDMLQGKQVKKGERIAVIENPEYIQLQQDYVDHKSQLEYQEADYKRQQALANENVNAQKSLQQAKASYFSKLAIVNGLQAKLKLLAIDFVSLEQGQIKSTINLYSPISGFITEVNFNIGSFLSPTDILFKIVDTGHLHAELTVFEKDVTKIKTGQKVRFTLAGSTIERFATVYLIGREISTDRTVRIHSHLDKEEKDLLPGMYLDAIIELGSNPVNTLPESAFVSYEGKHYIFIASKEQKTYERIEVSQGIKEFGYIEVSLIEGRNIDSLDVVTSGAYSLLSKMKNSEEEE